MFTLLVRNEDEYEKKTMIAKKKEQKVKAGKNHS